MAQIPPPNDATPLGHEHFFRFFGHELDIDTQRDSPLDAAHLGLINWHKTPAGAWCAGTIYFDREEGHELFRENRHWWRIASWEPLTLSPSLRCTACGDHGFIRNGKWIPV